MKEKKYSLKKSGPLSGKFIAFGLMFTLIVGTGSYKISKKLLYRDEEVNNNLSAIVYYRVKEDEINKKDLSNDISNVILVNTVSYGIKKDINKYYNGDSIIVLSSISDAERLIDKYPSARVISEEEAEDWLKNVNFSDEEILKILEKVGKTVDDVTKLLKN